MKRIAIVGTAGSWKQAPFDNPSVEIWSLNDAYRMDGFRRAERWYDFHPLDKYYFVPMNKQNQPATPIYAHQIPIDQYVRPEGHLDWLATQRIPVYLHPGYATQHPPAATWPQAHPFPRVAIEAHFGRYFTSSPAWMLAHAVMEGSKDIEIYGIHLATEHEYIDQRPNFEFLIGCILGSGKRTITVADGLRIYESNDGRVVLPVTSPVLDAKFQYAFEPSPRRKLEPLRWEMHKAQMKLARRLDALKTAAYWPFVHVKEPRDHDPNHFDMRRVSISTLQQEIRYCEAVVTDYQEQLARVGAGA